MSLISRIQTFIRVKTTAVINEAEDPRETLEYAYTHQQELLRQVKRGLVDVATARRQLEQQAQKLRTRVPTLEEQAARALQANREDLARLALQRKQTSLTEITRLDDQLKDLATEEQKLTQAEQHYGLRLDAFRTRREVLSARYTAAEAQVQVNETLTGLFNEAGNLGTAVERAEEKIERLQARASALDVLIETGALSTPGDDSLERQLNDLSAAQAVEAELAALKNKASGN